MREQYTAPSAELIEIELSDSIALLTCKCNVTLKKKNKGKDSLWVVDSIEGDYNGDALSDPVHMSNLFFDDADNNKENDFYITITDAATCFVS